MSETLVVGLIDSLL